MSDCIFCKIVAKESPNYTVYEDENVLAFLDIFPHAKGHTVLIPKKHYDNFFVMPESELAPLLVGVKKVMEKLEVALHPDGYNVGWNEKPVAGQTIGHLHFLIIPRYAGDGGGSVHSIVKTPGELAVPEVHKLIIGF
ncbi:MAG TPA: HIT family protein [Patescibacteria group bacterium]|nr:HIT family protein [Patescibacteria group bacterium]